jgi:hypothetical protein
MILVLVSGAISGRSGNQVAHDGGWWRAVDQYHHLGFLDGYSDCDGYVDPGPSRWNGFSPYDYEEKISSYYGAHPQELKRPVATVLLILAPPDKAVTEKSNFGSSAGEEWRQGGQSYRLGFVEGYLECLRSRTEKGVRYPFLYPMFPSGPGGYSQLVNWVYNNIENPNYVIFPSSMYPQREDFDE